jgi:hypothetical protein
VPDPPASASIFSEKTKSTPAVPRGWGLRTERRSQRRLTMMAEAARRRNELLDLRAHGLGYRQLAGGDFGASVAELFSTCRCRDDRSCQTTDRKLDRRMRAVRDGAHEHVIRHPAFRPVVSGSSAQ